MKRESKDLMQSLQTTMEKDVESIFSDSEIEDLHCIIRITVEFYDYLQGNHSIPSTPVETGQNRCLGNQPLSGSAIDEQRYKIATIFSGVESFTRVHAAYHVLVGALDGEPKWNMASMLFFKKTFVTMFDEFVLEENISRKYQLLLDLYKLQIIFAGINYN